MRISRISDESEDECESEDEEDQATLATQQTQQRVTGERKLHNLAMRTRGRLAKCHQSLPSKALERHAPVSEKCMEVLASTG